MLQSLSMKDYSDKLFKDFGLTIYDEVHHIGAEVFSRVLFRNVTQYSLGLSATMKRKDGLSKVFKMFLGEVVVKKVRKGEDNVLVKAIEYYHEDEEFSRVALNCTLSSNCLRSILSKVSSPGIFFIPLMVESQSLIRATKLSPFNLTSKRSSYSSRAPSTSAVLK